MRRIGLILFLVGLMFANPAFAQGWGEYVNMEERFLTNFPGEPVVEDYDYDYEKGQTTQFVAPVTAMRFQAVDGDSRYAIIVVNYQEVNHVTTLRGAVSHAASLYRKLGETSYDTYAHLERLDGHQLQLTLPDTRQMYVGIYFHHPDRRLYILEAEVPASAPPPQHFVAALQVLDEEGNPIRYQIDENGNATRQR
ncbi:MAG: hypothetical protein ACKVG0_01690 [Alphaproteobacteria bacterium]|jgi:hypothetical protein